MIRSHFASPRERILRAPVLGWSKHGDIYLDLGPVGGVRDDPSAHLARQTAEHFRAGRDRVVATDRLEVRSCHLGQEAGRALRHTVGPSPISSRAQSRLMIAW